MSRVKKVGDLTLRELKRNCKSKNNYCVNNCPFYDDCPGLLNDNIMMNIKLNQKVRVSDDE